MLSERGSAVLDAVVERFILTGEPVGSGAVARELPERVSAATVRNVMAELERLGLLDQPHTSAGRRPTAAGYRAYVENLFRHGRLAAIDPAPLQDRLASDPADVRALLRRTCRLLAELSELVGVVSAPPLAETIFQHIDFVALEGRRVLAVIVTRGGQVENRVVTLLEPMTQEQLDRASAYLVRRFAGRSLRQVAARLAELCAAANLRLEQFERDALALGARSLRTDLERSEVLVEGVHSLAKQPEFVAPESLAAVLEVIEERRALAPALEAREQQRPRVVIGARPLPRTLEGCALVAATYWSGGHPLGSVAVLGPTRLPYARTIVLVEAIARAASATLRRLGI